MQKIFTVALVVYIMAILSGCSDCESDSSQQLSAPIGLGAKATSSTSIRLNWAPVEPVKGSIHYYIEYDDGAGWQPEGAAYTNEYTVSELEAYTTYSFRVKAMDYSNSSEWSSTKSARTWIEAPLVLANKSGTTVTLNIAPVEGAAYYGVNYGTTSDKSSSKFFTTARPVNDGSIEPVKITGLTAGKTYYFFVTPGASAISPAEYATISVSL